MRARPSFVSPLLKSVVATGAVLALTLASLLAGAASAQADPTGSLSGTVAGHGGYTFNSDDFGAGAYAEVLVYPSDNQNEPASDTFAADDGSWTSAPLAFGEYKVLFVANTPGDGPRFFSQWWSTDGPTSDFSKAGVVDVTLGSSPSDVDMVMTGKPAASGTVVDSKGVPIADVTVNLYENGDIVAETITDELGDYYVSTDSEGSDYALEFESDDTPPMTAWLGGASEDTATALTLSENSVDNVGQTTLTVSTSISGTVTDAYGNALSGIDITATNAGNEVFNANTDADGNYLFDSVPAGMWSVTFADPSYNTATQTVDTTSTRHVTGIDQVMTTGGIISGLVTGKSGAHLSGTQPIDVDILNANGNTVASTTTSAGVYELDSVPFGTYSVQFVPEDPNTANYDQVTYTNKVTLSSTALRATVNQQLSAGGELTGLITTEKDGANQPEGVHVIVKSATSTREVEVMSFNSHLQASFAVHGLPSGTYTVEFDPTDDVTFATEWSSGKYSGASATKISVSAGKTVSSINDTVRKWVKPADLYVKAKSASEVTVGETLSVAAHVGTATVPTKHTSTYQWFRVGSSAGALPVNISKATKSTFVPSNAYAGYLIGVRITESATGYAPKATVITDPNQVSGAKFTTVPSKLALSGTASTGHALTAKFTGSFSPTPTKLDYTWEMNGVQVPVSWTPSLNQMYLGWDDLGNGNPYAGGNLTPPSDWLTAAGDVHFAQDDAITGVGGPGAVLNPQWSAKAITLKVCAERGQFYTRSCKTVTVNVAHDLALRSVPTITQVGAVLSAHPGTWHSATATSGTVTFAYQWYRDGVAISKAVTSTHTLTATDAGHDFTVRVTGSAKGYTSTSLMSAAVPAP